MSIFRYDDNNVAFLEKGLDYNHINIKGFNGTFSGFELGGSDIKATVKQLSFIDHSGLIVKNLTSEVHYNPDSIKLKNLNIELENTRLQAKYIDLLTENGTPDFQDFVNKVRFEANIFDSDIALTDLTYFVPQVDGMTDLVTINNVELSGPVSGMRLNNTKISLLSQTKLIGNFHIPDLSDDNPFYNQRNRLISNQCRRY